MNKTIMGMEFLFLTSVVIILQAGVDAQSSSTSRPTMCMTNTQCRNSQACVNLRCVNSCEDACGTNAKCNVRNHVAACSCPAGYSGDPFTACTAM